MQDGMGLRDRVGGRGDLWSGHAFLAHAGNIGNARQPGKSIMQLWVQPQTSAICSCTEKSTEKLHTHTSLCFLYNTILCSALLLPPHPQTCCTTAPPTHLLHNRSARAKLGGEYAAVSKQRRNILQNILRQAAGETQLRTPFHLADTHPEVCYLTCK